MLPIRSALRSLIAVACVLSMAACGGSGDDAADPGTPPPGGGNGPGSGGPASHMVSIAVQGTGSGDVEAMNTGLPCGAACSTEYPDGTTVKLAAIPARGSVFDGWEGACSGTDACVLTVAEARSVVARFSLAETIAPAGTWIKGDLHVHDDHSSDGSAPRQLNDDKAKGNLSVADQIGQATRLGLEYLPLTDHRTYDQHYDPLWESSSLLLIPGEEANGSPHAISVGGVDSVVQGAGRADRAAFTHVQQSVWDAHSQGASWTVAHPDDGETNKDNTPNANASVQGVNLVEVWNRGDSAEKEIDYAENRWNAGFRFGVAGASDSHFREYWDRAAPGMPTSNVMAKAYNERGMIDALQGGRTSLSIDPTGPFIAISTDLKGGGYTAIGGDEVFVPAGTAGHLRVNVQRAAGMQVLVYRKPGRSAGALKTVTPVRDDETFLVDIKAGDQPDWYRVEVRGMSIPKPWAPVSVMELKATVSPLFISPGPVEATPEIAVPKDIGNDDGALRVAGARGEFAGFPDVATEAGVVHFVAETHGDAASTIVYRRQDEKGVWNDAGRTLSGHGLARFPRVAVKGKDVWVTWQEDAVQIPHRPLINLRHSADGGITWQAIQTVRSLEGRAEHPDIAIAANGKPLLVWQEIQSGQPFDVMIQEIGTDAQPKNLSRAGKTIDAGSPDDTRSPRYPASVWPALAVAADGRVAVTWQDNRNDVDPLWTGTAAGGEGSDPDDWQIQVVARNASGVWGNPVILGATDLSDRHPDVAFSSTGELVLVWESKEMRSSGRNLSVRAAVSADGGATFSAPGVLAPDTLTMSQRARLGVDKDGAVRAVWYDSRSADWRWRVMTAVYRKDAGWTAGTLLNGRGINTWPVTSGGVIAFASTRNATRLQRDRTQQVFLVQAK